MATITKQTCNLIVQIDTSGSMGSNVGTVDGTENNFTRLDLVKHSLRTIVGMLGEHDSLSLIDFSSAANIVLQPTLMTTSNKVAVNTIINNLRADGSTNIYDAIMKSVDICTRAENVGKEFISMLLTDGCPNINPPRGILETLKSKPTNLTMFTFAFGYDIDSKLLFDLSVYGEGGFGFIPDCTMVGTVFINAMAHILTKNSSGVVDTHSDDPSDSHDPAPLVGGGGAGAGAGATAPATTTTTDINNFNQFHNEYLDTLFESISHMKTNHTLSITKLNELYEKYKTSTNEKIIAALKDIQSTNESEGQIGMAPKYAEKWGIHYTRAYLRAQTLQYTMNFKDPGLQIYSNAAFQRMQEIGDDLFVSLPPPTPSGYSSSYGTYGGYGAGAASAATLTSMAVFHNASGGCFAPNSLVKMSDNSYKKIQDINPGDSVYTPIGASNVIALVTCGSYKQYQPMSNINKLWITPYHPILFENEWKFPASIAFYCERLMPFVYNLVLESGHIVEVNDFLCVTLGHGFEDHVVKHEYFGTNKVIEDLMNLPGWSIGRPCFTNLVAIKNNEGKICAWIDDI
jgi:hypothetical protein